MSKKFGAYLKHYVGEDLDALLIDKNYWIHYNLSNSIIWIGQAFGIEYSGTICVIHKSVINNKIQQRLSIWAKGGEKEKFSEAKKVGYKFCSAVTWFLGYTVHPQHIYGSGRFGGPFDVGVTPLKLIGLNYLHDELSQDERISLAYWREAKVLEDTNISFSLLSYYKIIEANLKKHRIDRKKWFKDKIDNPSKNIEREILTIKQYTSDVSDYLYKSCRCAIAHGSLHDEIVDPDIPEDLERAYFSLGLMRELARTYIREEFNLGTANELNDFLPTAKPIIDEILNVNGGWSGESLQLYEMRIWPYKKLSSLGMMRVNALNKDSDYYYGTLTINEIIMWPFTIKIQTMRICLNYLDVIINENISESHPNILIDILKALEALISNKVIELIDNNDNIITCDVVIPVNIDQIRSCEKFELKIKELEMLANKRST